MDNDGEDSHGILDHSHTHQVSNGHTAYPPQALKKMAKLFYQSTEWIDAMTGAYSFGVKRKRAAPTEEEAEEEVPMEEGMEEAEDLFDTPPVSSTF